MEMKTKEVPPPESFELLEKFICPPSFWPALGYEGSGRYVAIYWEQGGDEACYHDGNSALCGANWPAYNKLLDYNYPPNHPVKMTTGGSDISTKNWIVIERSDSNFPRAWLAPRNDAEQFLGTQWNRPENPEPLTQADLDTIMDFFKNAPAPSISYERIMQLMAADAVAYRQFEDDLTSVPAPWDVDCWTREWMAKFAEDA